MSEVAAHLSNCLLCGACEKNCPSGVSFEEIMNEARTHTEYPAQPVLFRKLSDVHYHRRLAPWLRLYQKSGLQALARATGIVQKTPWGSLEATLPSLSKQRDFRERYPAQDSSGRSVALFTGCTSIPYQPETLSAAIAVLNHLGIDVQIPKQQVCCGALDAHAGRVENADALQLKNQTLFSELKVEAIVGVTTGCTAFLKGNQQSDIPFVDILEFLLQQDAFRNIAFKPLQKKVALHLPCSLVNQLKQPLNPKRCLERIPEIQLASLASNRFCCGAAGTYFLEHSETSKQLLQPRLDEIQATQPDLIASPNLGCSLHLLQGLNAIKLAIPVKHPIELLAEALPY